MGKFHPPIHSLENDELIKIIYGDETTWGGWVPDAISLAKMELEKRGISIKQQKIRVEELMEQDFQGLFEELERRRDEDYEFLEKIMIVIRWPRELFWKWDLRREGYFLKAERRIQLIILGILVYILAVLLVSISIMLEQS